MYFKLALGNVRKSIRDYGIYFLTLVFGVCVFYAFNSIMEHESLLQVNSSQGELLELLSILIGWVSVFIAIVLGFLVVYASRYLIRRRKKEFGIYLTLGMPTIKVSKVIVYETLFVGLISLVVGILVGIALSQALLFVTAAMFEVTMDMFTFVFSEGALIKTLLYFGVIFVIALVFNVFSISRYRLIDLIHAERKNEGIKLRNLALSVILFLVSLALIGTAYWLLIDNGLREFNMQFALSTALVCAGTLLLFFSLAGFLLRAVRLNKGIYFRGINMFTLRQLNSKINTTFLSISLVCMALFLAITATCGGFALASSFNKSMQMATPYDATIRASYTEDDIHWKEAASADNYDMVTTLKRDIPHWDDLVAGSAQTTIYPSDVTPQDLLDVTDVEMNNSLFTNDVGSQVLFLTTLSDLNNQLKLMGQDPLTLAEDEFLFWCDFDAMKEVYTAFAEQNDALEVYGTTLRPAENALEELISETSGMPMNTGTIVVPDSVVADLPETIHPYSYTLNVMYNGDRFEIEPLFTGALAEAYHDDDGYLTHGWPFLFELTAVEMYEQNTGLTAMITYLAIYIGFVLLIACAAILALQQLSEAADNVTRYSLLKKIGVEQKMINRALFVQIGIYFLFPLVVALCHACVALSVFSDVVFVIGGGNLAGSLVITVALFVVIYGGYFLLTYFSSRTMINQKIKVH